MFKFLIAISSFLAIPGLAMADLSQYSTSALMQEIASRIDGGGGGNSGGRFQIDFNCSGSNRYAVKFSVISATSHTTSAELGQYTNGRSWLPCAEMATKYQAKFGGTFSGFTLVKMCTDSDLHIFRVTPSGIEEIERRPGGRESCYQTIGLAI